MGQAAAACAHVYQQCITLYLEHALQHFRTHIVLGCSAPSCNMALREGQSSTLEAIEPRAPEHWAGLRHGVIYVQTKV